MPLCKAMMTDQKPDIVYALTGFCFRGFRHIMLRGAVYMFTKLFAKTCHLIWFHSGCQFYLQSNRSFLFYGYQNQEYMA